MKRHAAGFTLIELLISIAIFSVMSVFAYQGLRNFLTARAVVDAQEEAFGALIGAMSVLQQDIEEIAPRPVRDELGDPEAALRSGRDRAEIMALTRHTAWASVATRSADLKRVEYYLEEGQLVRRVWHVLDRVPDAAFAERAVLTGVAAVRVRFFGKEGWTEQWPVSDLAIENASLPAAIAVAIEFENGRQVERIVRIHDAS